MKKQNKKKTKSARPQLRELPENTQDIIEVILEHHQPLKILIRTLKGENTYTDKKEAFAKFAPLLTAHAKAEEKILYSRMKKKSDLSTDAFEGEIEHGLADQLAKSSKSSKARSAWMAKVKVLAELVEHHIQEEENEVFSKVKKEISDEQRLQMSAPYLALYEGYLRRHHFSRDEIPTENLAQMAIDKVKDVVVPFIQ